MLKMGLGMWLYDALSLFRTPELHERLNPKACEEKLQLLQAENLLGAYAYSDAYMDDDRLVLETLRSAHSYGALCANYVRATGAKKDEKGCVNELVCRDGLSGKEFSIKGQHFVSTVGVWTDELGEKVFNQWDSIMRPSKGVHITFSRKRFPLETAVVMAAEKRIVFGIPRNDWVIVGTTDTDYNGDPAQVHTTPEDIKYLLGVTDKYFPKAQLTEEDIISSYAGVRPLVDDGAASEGKTSREHVILSDRRNITFVAGGKYTTYRNMAEETVDRCLSWLPLERQAQLKPCQTNTPLNPHVTTETYGEVFELAKRAAAQFSLENEITEALALRHGNEVFSLLHEHLPKCETYKGDTKLWALELHHAIATTMCLSLRDFVLRRTPLFLSEKDQGQKDYELWQQILSEEISNNEFSTQSLPPLSGHIDRELNWKSIDSPKAF